MNNKNIPVIRFPGFKTEWEEKYLSEFLIESNIRNRNENKNIPVFSVSNQGFVLQQEYFKGREIASKIKNNYKIVTKNTFAYNPACINIGSIALFNHDIGQVSPMYVVFTTKKIINDYLNFYFHSTLFKKQIINNLEGSVRKVINFKKIILFKIYVPVNESSLSLSLSNSEQDKIATFFTLIDRKIELLTKIIDCLIKIKKYLLNLFLEYVFSFGEKRNFLDLFEEIKIKNNNLLPQFTVGKHGIKKITEIKYRINNHKVFLKNCLLIGLGLEEIGFSDNLSGCVSPVYRVYKIKNNDYLDVLKYTIKKQLWYQKRFISKKSIRREYEINHQEIKKIFISVMNNPKIIPFSQSLFLINQKTEIIQQQKEKIIQIKKYLLNKMFVND